VLMIISIPLGPQGLAILYGLSGAVRPLNGAEFRYAIVGRWLNNTQQPDLGTRFQPDSYRNQTRV